MAKQKRNITISLIVIVAAFFIGIIAFNFINNNDGSKIRVHALNGPTTVSLLAMTDDDKYEFNKSSQADAIVADIASNNTDIALIPANLAPILYKKTNGGIKIIDINTLSVIKTISQKQDITNFKGMRLYSTGKGTVVEALVNVFLKANGLEKTDVDLQFKSEASEVISFLKQDSNSIGFINEPQASVCTQKFDDLHFVADISKYWKKLYGENENQITGVTIATKEFLDNNKSQVKTFMKDHKKSIDNIKDSSTDKWVNSLKEKFPDLSMYANHDTINNCNNEYIDGQEMKNSLNSLYEKFLEIDPSLIGGNIPSDDIYFLDK